MDSVSGAAADASAATQNSLGEAVSVSVLKRAMNQQAASAATLIASVQIAPPALATSGTLGTQVNTFA